MKNQFTFFKTALLAAILLVGSANAWGQTRLFDEDFNYTISTRLTANGYSQVSPSTSNYLTVVSGNLTKSGYQSTAVGNYVELKTSGEDVYKNLSAEKTSGNVYFAALVNFSSVQSNDYFLALNDGSAAYYGKIAARKLTATNNKVKFGISKSAANITATPATNVIVFADGEYEENTTYLLVVKYEIKTGATNDVASLWINPVSSTIEPTPDAVSIDVTGSDPSKISAIAIRQDTTSSAPAGVIDAIRVATAWADLFEPAPSCTPSAQSITVKSLMPSDLGQRYLGDKLWYNFSHNWNDSWNATEVGFGINANGSDWDWDAATYYTHDDQGSDCDNSSVHRQVQFTATGDYYIIGRAKGSSSDEYVYATQACSNDAICFSSSLASTVEVLALEAPLAPSATASTGLTPQIDLQATEWIGRRILIVRYPAGDTEVAPTNNTEYSVSQTLGTGVVVFNAFGTGDPDTQADVANFADISVTAGTAYDYYFYSENYKYYSPAAKVENVTYEQAYEVTFSPEGGECTTTTLTGSSINLPVATPSAICAALGWTFAGWVENAPIAEGENPIFVPSPYTPTATTTLYAVYKKEGEAVAPTYTPNATAQQFVIAAKVGSDYFGIPASPTVSSGKIEGVNITAKVTDDSYVKISDASGYAWTIRSGTSYLQYTGTSGTNLKYSALDANNFWTINSGTHGTYSVRDKETTARGLIYQIVDGAASNRFGGYSESNVNGSAYTDLELLPIGDGVSYIYNSNPDCCPIVTAAPTSITADASISAEPYQTTINVKGVNLSSDINVTATDLNKGTITFGAGEEASLVITQADAENAAGYDLQITVTSTGGGEGSGNILLAFAYEESCPSAGASPIIIPVTWNSQRPTNVNNSTAGETVLSTEYFTLSGQRLGTSAETLPNGVYIVKKHTATRTVVEKLMIRK
jgi:hypothetical protein